VWGYEKGYKDNIEKLTLQNENFRQVLYTAAHCQLVLMSLKPGEEIGMEVHEGTTSFSALKMDGKVIINETEYAVSNGDAVIVPCGAKHNYQYLTNRSA